MINGSAIVFTLSGGTANADPNLSLGGDPSAQPIIGVTNNMFEDISQELATSGYTDYRCFYVFNNNSLDSMFGTVVYVKSQIDLGASVQIGVSKETDAQKITVSGTVSGGSFTIAYEGENAVVNYHGDLATWANNIITALNASTGLSGVEVNSSGGGGSVVFNLLFQGDDDNRNHSLLTVVSNDLGGENTIAVSKTVEGSPINSIPAGIDFSTIAPSGVTFVDTSSIAPIVLGTLKALDGVPIWIKRTTPEGAGAVLGDGFTLAISGSPTLHSDIMS